MARFLTVLLLLPSLLCFGATYYIDFASGDNSNSGTSTNAPWKHAPGDGRATGGPAGTSLSAGDEVLFKRGVSYIITNSIQLNWSGTSNAPIRYADYGAGDAPTITAEDLAITMYGFDAPSLKSGLSFQNLRFWNIGGYRVDNPIWSTDTQGCTTNLITAPPSGAGIRMANGSANIWVQNCSFEEIGTWTNSSPLSGTVSVTGTGVAFEGGTNIFIENCSFTKMRVGVRIQGGATKHINNVWVTNSVFRDYMVWLIDVSSSSSDARFNGLYLIGNSLYDKTQHDQSYWTGCNDAPHTDGMFLRNSGTRAVWTNVVIAHNKFWSDSESSNGTAMIYLSEGGGGDCAIIGNTFRNVQDTTCIFVGPTSRQGNRTVRILQNSFLNTARAIRVTGTNHTFVVRDNIFVRDVTQNNVAIINYEAYNPITSDYNIYWNPQIPTGTYYSFYLSGAAWLGGGYTTFSTWQGKGYDQNSVYADPRFVDGTNAVPSLRDLSVTSLSPAIDAGSLESDYSEISQWTSVDITGASRGASWDIGAFEYDGNDPDPPSDPSPLRISTGRLSVGRIE